MPGHTLQFPPLAGLCSKPDAQRIAQDVAASTAALHRLAYASQRLAIMAAAWLPSSPEWELKQALAYHGWLDAEHARWIYRRIAEMREPPPRMHDIPAVSLETAFDLAMAADSTPDRVAAMYGVLRPALRLALEEYLERSHPLADQPSCRVINGVLGEERAIEPWGEAALGAVGTLAGGSATRADGVQQALKDAGGVFGLGATRAAAGPASPLGRYEADILPRRDGRFSGLFDTSTPADTAYLDEARPVEERNAALMFKRVREMDVPEVIAGIIAERWMGARNAIRAGGSAAGPDWDYYANMFRQMWDEARHSMLGETLLEHRGVDWHRLPINVTFSWKLARCCDPVDRHVLLYAIEQSLMPRTTGKPYEHRIAEQAGDQLSALFHDFDWADEVLHVEIARRCLRPELPGGLAEARERADRLWQQIGEALEKDPLPVEADPPGDWWTDYVRAITGRTPASLPATHVKDWRPNATPGPVSG